MSKKQKPAAPPDEKAEEQKQEEPKQGRQRALTGFALGEAPSTGVRPGLTMGEMLDPFGEHRRGERK